MSSFSSVRVVVLNASRVDWDKKINWSSLALNTIVFHDVVGENPSEDEIVNRCQNCDVVVTKEIMISEDVIIRLPNDVKLICEAGTGYNNISLNACRSRGITVTNVPSYSEEAVASLVITFVLNFSCGLLELQRELWEGKRSRFMRGLPSDSHFEVSGKTLGLVGGRGNIGSRVAQTALSLGMRVLISTRSPPTPTSTSTPSPALSASTTAATATASELGSGSGSGLGDASSSIRYTDSVEQLLRESDFVSLHCPLNEETRHLIDERALSLMKPSAYLINTARGAIIDEAALIRALQSQTIAGAALDVQTVEPPNPDSLLYTLPNCVMTPHIGWKRLETRQRVVEVVASNIRMFQEGTPENVVS